MRELGDVDARLNWLSEALIGAAIEVHRALGRGFLEAVYEQALCMELRERGIPFARQVVIEVSYRGHRVGEGRLDLLIAGELVLELKATEGLAPLHKAQLLSYLKTCGYRLGLLINFNTPRLVDGISRVIEPERPLKSSGPLRLCV